MKMASQVFLDSEVRMTAFDWLSRKSFEYGDVLPRAILIKGFDYQGTRVPLLGPQGIFKPKIIPNIPLSITTAPKGPYDDSFGEDGFLLYKYRGINPQHHENVGLRTAMMRGTPLIYFHGVVPGMYLAVWPVFIIGDIPERLTFKVAADDMYYSHKPSREQSARPESVRYEDNTSRRIYITSIVRQRLHQRGFRERVLAAYQERCALCRLSHRELLDAAHIIPDSQPGGEPHVKNGIALCKLHHAAFDNFFIGIRPDYIVQVRKDVLSETDGPMLLHGLQGIHNTKLIIPKQKDHHPAPELLEQRWRRFAEFTQAG